VSQDVCPPRTPPPPVQTGPPWNGQIQNHTAATGQPPPTGLPFDTITCLDPTGSSVFEDNGVLTSIYNRRLDLDLEGVSRSTSLQGTLYDLSIQPLSGPRVNFTVAVDVPEANPDVDFIQIPNTTGAPKPSGFALTDAKLGVAQTISWTQPTFPVRDLFVTPIVYLSDGRFCSGVQPNVSTTSTQVTYTLPATCFGRTATSPAPNIVKANVCINYQGENGEASSGCWFFGAP
jgi:hypothetical protein